jgi:sugar phosphate isomerase/epimerase
MIFPETMGGDGPIVETISKIASDDFFSMVEIGHINDPEARKEAANLIKAAHLRVAYGAQPSILSRNLNLNSPDPTKREEAVSGIKTLVDEAKSVGAKRLTVLSGPDPGERNRAVARKLLIQSLLELCAYAKEKPLSITLETFDRTIDKKSLIGPASEALEVSKAVRAKFPDFGLMYDMGHAPLLSEDPGYALRLLKDQLVHVHIGNCVKTLGHPAYGDQHPRFGLDGGENDVSQLVQFLRALFDVGYLSRSPQEVSPVVGFELKPRPDEKPEAVIANGKRTWRKAWSLL